MSILSLLPVIEGGSTRPVGGVTWNLKEMRGEKLSGIDSLCQSIRLALEVPRYRCPIYSWQYGSELETLIGSSFEQVSEKAPAMIRDALERDDRIQSVDGFIITRSEQRGTADISFTVHSELGSIEGYWTVETG